MEIAHLKPSSDQKVGPIVAERCDKNAKKVILLMQDILVSYRGYVLNAQFA